MLMGVGEGGGVCVSRGDHRGLGEEPVFVPGLVQPGALRLRSREGSLNMAGQIGRAHV